MEIEFKNQYQLKFVLFWDTDILKHFKLSLYGNHVCCRQCLKSRNKNFRSFWLFSKKWSFIHLSRLVRRMSAPLFTKLLLFGLWRLTTFLENCVKGHFRRMQQVLFRWHYGASNSRPFDRQSEVLLLSWPTVELF